ncbi:MAG: hypothetical protein MI785_14905 [Kiloniellales bacterium]|nr:hypothetical protein [Kiloniellales bacterium]
MTAEAKDLGAAAAAMMTAISEIEGRYELRSSEVMGCLITVVAHAHACRVMDAARSEAAVEDFLAEFKIQAAEWLRSPDVLQERRRRGLDGPGQVGHA